MENKHQFVDGAAQNIKKTFYQYFEDSNAQAVQLERSVVLTLCGLSLAFFFVALTGFVTQGHQWAFFSVNAIGAHIPDAVLHNLTSFGDGIFIVVLLLTIANRKIPLLYTGLLAAIIGGLVSQSLKRYFNADRPPAVLELETFHLVGKAYYSRSFPSGHTLTAFLMATVFICFTQKKRYQLLLIALAMLVGLSRVWLGVHWVIDILVGGALGMLSGLLAVYIAKRTQIRLHPFVAAFALILYTIVALTALIEPNDYHLAQFMISGVAICALWQVYKHYLSSPIYHWLNAHLALTLKNAFFVTLFVITLYRILVILQPHLTLFYDEAYYYHWSLNLDAGYYSKPPMVAWLITVTTSLFGSTVLGVKLAAPVLYSASAYLIYLIASNVSNTKAGVYAGLIFISAPVIGFNSEFITTDAPLVFFWCLSVFLFIQAITSNLLRYWLLLGISVGLGMLSKYTMAILPMSLFAFLAFDKTYRARLFSYKPWLAAIIAGILFAINLWWNSQHGWISFVHTSEISQQAKNSVNVLGLLEFWAGQIFVLGPVWIWLGVSLFKRRRELSPPLEGQSKLFWFVALGILIVISIQAISSRAFVNWAAPWIVGASLLLGVYSASTSLANKATQDRTRRLFRLGLISHLLLLSAFYHWPQILNHLHIEQSRKNNPYQRVAGWEAVSSQLAPYFQRSPDAILASDSRDLLAYLGFHTLPGKSMFARWNPDENNIRDHYDLKYNFRRYADTDKRFIFVSKKPVSPKVIARFDHARSLGKIEHPVFKDKRHLVHLYEFRGFNGYE